MLDRKPPLKLDDCATHGAASGAELFIVEGDSASGAVRRIRDERFQAVLPMQGKPLNAIKASAAKVLAYPLFVALIDALGAGAGAGFDRAKARYERIVLLMDADADGIHCSALMLLFFYRMMRPLLEDGALVLARAPMASITHASLAQPLHLHSEAHYRAACEQLRNSGVSDFTTVRYRGLAGIDLETLAATCVTPATRALRTLSSADAQAAMEIFGGTTPRQPL